VRPREVALGAIGAKGQCPRPGGPLSNSQGSLSRLCRDMPICVLQAHFGRAPVPVCTCCGYSAHFARHRHLVHRDTERDAPATSCTLGCGRVTKFPWGLAGLFPEPQQRFTTSERLNDKGKSTAYYESRGIPVCYGRKGTASSSVTLHGACTSRI